MQGATALAFDIRGGLPSAPPSDVSAPMQQRNGAGLGGRRVPALQLLLGSLARARVACQPDFPPPTPNPKRTHKILEKHTPSPPQVPSLKVFVQNDETKKYCNTEITTAALLAGAVNGSSAAALPGGWARFVVPFGAFRCDYEGATPGEVDRLDIQNPAPPPGNAVDFCLDNVEIRR
jgi:hypothetical protein